MSSSSPQSPFVSPFLGAIFGITAASTAAIFIRYAQHEGAPSLVIAACRLTIATLVLAPIALSRRRIELAALTRRELGLALLSGLFLALHFASWISSLEYTTVASSVVLVIDHPVVGGCCSRPSPYASRSPVGNWRECWLRWQAGW